MLAVSLCSDCGRKTFSEINVGDELRASRRSERQSATANGTFYTRDAGPKRWLNQRLVQWLVGDNDPRHTLSDLGQVSAELRGKFAQSRDGGQGIAWRYVKYAANDK
jgi:hypothetical protein